MPDKSTEDFLAHCINRGAAECVVPIKSVFAVLEELLRTMKQRALPSEQVVAIKDRSLKCICPKCGYTIDGAGLGALHMVYTEGVDNVTLTGRSEKARRFLGGSCVNGSCSSHEVILRWQDELKRTADWILDEFPLAMKPESQPSPSASSVHVEGGSPMPNQKKPWWCFWRKV